MDEFKIITGHILRFINKEGRDFPLLVLLNQKRFKEETIGVTKLNGYIVGWINENTEDASHLLD